MPKRPSLEMSATMVKWETVLCPTEMLNIDSPRTFIGDPSAESSCFEGG